MKKKKKNRCLKKYFDKLDKLIEKMVSSLQNATKSFPLS